MIRSPDNEKLKTIRKLQQKRWREKLDLFADVSTLGSGTGVIGVYKRRWADPAGDVLVYLHGVEDPGNVGTIIRSAHALADATVVLGPGCADPFSPKAVRASMGSIFARPPARAALAKLP